MSVERSEYEELGKFYLGKEYDADTREVKDELVIYKSSHLTTHGVCLGMTGSGKTGLCLALLEEAAMDGVPALIIDPKGDIGNIMLTFPELRGEDFEPWVNEDEARRKGLSKEDFAQGQADLWKKGLAEWGQGPERIAELREKVDMRIYTPGSNSGIPLSILSSLNAPDQRVMDDEELLTDRVVNTVSSILGLLGSTKDPQESEEHSFLCELFSHVWQKGENVDMQTLIRLILRPPFEKVGEFSVDEHLSPDKRDELAKSLNNLVASPGFSAWLVGCPLNIQSLLYTPEGKPRLAILSIAHLTDDERMFFVTLVLNELTSWMRMQSGTTSLRALFYMDEIFGYLPPVSMPPSKRPMLLLLKQARAFGLGLLLATQNPVDLDYKALSNIGTWWLGRLQTQRDKDRVLDGLEGAAGQQGAQFDRKRIDRLLSELETRVFLMNNVHEGAPTLFSVRWVMSYLCGPLTRNQIEVLMDPVRKEAEKEMLSASDLTGATMVIPRPVIPRGIDEVFVPTRTRVKGAKYVPHLLRQARYVVSAGDVRSQQEVVQLLPFDRKGQVDAKNAIELPCALADLMRLPEDGIEFEDPPNTLGRSFFSEVKVDFTDEIYTGHGVKIWNTEHPKVKDQSKPGETEEEFRGRLAEKVDAARLPEENKLVGTYEKWVAEKWTPAYEKAKAEHKKRWWGWIKAIFKPLIILGAFVVSILMSNKKGGVAGVMAGTSKTELNRATSAAGSIVGSVPDGDKVRGKTKVELEAEQEARKAQLENELARLREEYSAEKIRLEVEMVRPYKKDIDVELVALAWVVE